jgi:hypothetical protein
VLRATWSHIAVLSASLVFWETGLGVFYVLRTSRFILAADSNTGRGSKQSQEEKEARLRGFYIRPELCNAPEKKQVKWARHPGKMQRMKEIKTRGVLAMAGAPREAAR